MKKIFFTALIALPFYSFSQNATTQTKVASEQSKAEAFSDKSGTLIQKQFIDIGKIKTSTVQVAIFTDLISNQKTSAVRFEKPYSTSYTSDTKVALLDADELDGLFKSIKIIQEKVLPTAPADYTEVNFRSRSGFSAGSFYSKNKWAAYLKLERFDSNSYLWLDPEDLASLVTLLEQAKAKLIL